MLEFMGWLRKVEMDRLEMYKRMFVNLIMKERQFYGSETRNKDEIAVLWGLDCEQELV